MGCFYNFLDHHCLVSGLSHSQLPLENTFPIPKLHQPCSSKMWVSLSCFLFFLPEALLFCSVIFSWSAAKTIKSLNYSLSRTQKTQTNHPKKKKKKKITALSAHGHGSIPHRPFYFLLYFYKASLTFCGK